MKKTSLALAAWLALAAVAPGRDRPLRLAVRSDKPAYKVGDVIVLVLEWSNPGPMDAQIQFRDDGLIGGLLEFTDARGERLPMARAALWEFAPEHKVTLGAGEAYEFRLEGKISRREYVEPELKEIQKYHGAIVLEFEGGVLSETPVLLGTPGTFGVAAKYEISADSYLARTEPETWTGAAAAPAISISVTDDQAGLTREQACAIAEKIARENDLKTSHYLKSAEEAEWQGRGVWFITYALIPGEKTLPAGGEWFIRIDKATGETSVTRGE